MESVREEKPETPPREYLIYFVDREDRRWWDYVFRTREGFRHCFMMVWDEWSNRWLLVDWLQTRMDFTILFDFEAEQYMRQIHRSKGTVVRYSMDAEADAPIGILTYCSNLLARYLGLGKYLILTPEGLYRKLLATGGEVVYSWRDHDEAQDAESEPGAETA